MPAYTKFSRVWTQAITVFTRMLITFHLSSIVLLQGLVWIRRKSHGCFYLIIFSLDQYTPGYLTFPSNKSHTV